MKILNIIIISLLMMGGVIAGMSMGNTPDITTDITKNEKIEMKEKFDATGYMINSCWWIDECYFCNIKIGELSLTKRAITCNFEEDRKIYNETGSWIDDMGMQDLVDEDVIQIVKAHTKDKVINSDDQHLDGVIKSWK